MSIYEFMQLTKKKVDKFIRKWYKITVTRII